jgi:hypothetical protein
VRRRRDPARLGPLATVGAWLGIWTPPRGVDVPPVPWRRLGAGAVALIAVATVGAALVWPRVQAARERRLAAEESAAAARAASERRRVALEQRAQRGAAPELRSRGARSPAEELRARRALLSRVEADITRDARRRARAGLLEGPILRTSCTPNPRSLVRRGAEEDLSRPAGSYGCLAVNRDIHDASGRRGAIGHPFRAVVDFERFSYTWCKVNPVPGERAVPDPRRLVPLPQACILAPMP